MSFIRKYYKNRGQNSFFWIKIENLLTINFKDLEYIIACEKWWSAYHYTCIRTRNCCSMLPTTRYLPKIFARELWPKKKEKLKEKIYIYTSKIVLQFFTSMSRPFFEGI